MQGSEQRRGGSRRKDMSEMQDQVARAPAGPHLRGRLAQPGTVPWQDHAAEQALSQARSSPSEVETYCPQPVRASPFLVQINPLPGSPSFGGAGTQAETELRELFDTNATPEGGDPRLQLLEHSAYVKAVDNRPDSTVSTSAGPTPIPEELTLALHGVSDAAVRFDSEKSNKAQVSNIPAQVRKIFVGGIPQDMSQSEIYNMFNKFSPVKKAWLQKYRANQLVSGPPVGDLANGKKAWHNHRGFGFVIFYEPTAVDQLLGPNFSRYISVRDGARLEVKRAVSSSDMATGPPHAQAAPQATGRLQQPRSAQQPSHGRGNAGPCAATGALPQAPWQPHSSPVRSVLMTQPTSMPWTPGAHGARAGPQAVVQRSSIASGCGGAPGQPLDPGLAMPGQMAGQVVRGGSMVPAQWIIPGHSSTSSVPPWLGERRSAERGGAPAGEVASGTNAATMLARQALMTPDGQQLDLTPQSLANVLMKAMPDHYDD